MKLVLTSLAVTLAAQPLPPVRAPGPPQPPRYATVTEANPAQLEMGGAPMREPMLSQIAAASPTLVYKTAQIPADVLAAIAFDTGPLVDPDQPLAPPAKSQDKTGRLIWGARVGDYYVVHWEKVFKTGPARQVSVVQYGPKGAPYLVWKTGFACEPFDDLLSVSGSLRCSTPTALDSFKAFQQALGAPLLNPTGAPAAGGRRIAPPDPAASVRPTMPDEVKAAVLAAQNAPSVTKVADLPVDIQTLLVSVISRRTDTPLTKLMANGGENFTMFDMVVTNRDGTIPPFARLDWATRVGSYYVVGWERGGMGGSAMVYIYRYEADGRPRMIWQGGRIAVLGDPRRVMGDFSIFQAALANDEISTIGAGAACAHPQQIAPAIAALMDGPAPAKPAVRKLADIPDGIPSLLPYPGRTLDADQALSPPATPGDPVNSRLSWATQVGGIWFVELEAISLPKPGGPSLGPPPVGPQQSFSMIAFDETSAGPRKILQEAWGPYRSIDEFRDLVKRNTPLDLAASIAAGKCGGG